MRDITDFCCQLHVHSNLSFKDGLPAPEALVARAAELGQPGIGLTEHGHLYSSQRFFDACKEHEIKGVIGCEVYEAVPHTWDPEGPHAKVFKEKWDPNVPRYYHLTLWAQNQVGWENLCAIHTQSFTSDYKPKNQPLVDRATLERHSEGVICGMGCIGSRSNQALMRGQWEPSVTDWYAEVYGDRFWVEVMANLDDQVKLLSEQRAIAKRYGRPTVGTNDVHYLRREDGIEGGAHHTLVQARKWRSSSTAEAESSDASDDAFGSWYGSDQFYMKTRDEMLASGIFPEEINAQLAILDSVDFDYNGTMLKAFAPPSARVPSEGEDPEFDAWLASH